MLVKDMIVIISEGLLDPAGKNMPTISSLLLTIRQSMDGSDDLIDAPELLSLCQRLYTVGRSSDALEIARVVRLYAARARDRHLHWRAETAAGNLLSDSGQFVAAISHHAGALRIAERLEDADKAARSWANLGACFYYGASYDFAIEALSLAIKTAPRNKSNSMAIYVAYINLSDCYFHVGNFEEGMAIANRAFAAESPALVNTDLQNAILLRRNVVRLLIMSNLARRAKPYVDEIIAMSKLSGSKRSEIAAMTTQALYEMASGKASEGLARLRSAAVLAEDHPPALINALTCLVQAEEMAGNSEAAEVCSKQLAESVYRDFNQQWAASVTETTWLSHGSTTSMRTSNIAAEMTSQYVIDGEQAHWATLERIATTAGLRCDGLVWHGARVGELVRLLAYDVGLPEIESDEIGIAAKIHDIGMISLPGTLLAKRGEWTENQRQMLKMHCQIGPEMIKSVPGKRMALAGSIAEHHHEWWDGSGYPNGLAGDAIPLAARLCTIADVFDALISARSYRAGLPINVAADRLLALKGTQLDPELVDCFVASLFKGRIGAFAQAEMLAEASASYSLDGTIERFRRVLH